MQSLYTSVDISLAKINVFPSPHNHIELSIRLIAKNHTQIVRTLTILDIDCSTVINGSVTCRTWVIPAIKLEKNFDYENVILS